LTVDILARLTFSLFPNPSPSLTPLLHQTFTPETLAKTTCVILLDWSTPWKWLRDLRDWIAVVMGFLHETTRAPEYEAVVNDIIAQCNKSVGLSLIVGEAAIRGYSEKPTTSNSVSTESTLLPLGQGEYDEPIGLPLVVVCQNVGPKKS
jgi:dynein light intermediate chain 1, cytosolic